ncbi:hypothetical protein PILCRDRAFT_75720, partial [Piloderma croceum F 1598]
IVAPVADCQTLQNILGSFFALGLSSTSLLFLSRVRAVYDNSKIITAFFGSMWVATLGLSTIIPLSIDGEHIGLTNQCIKTDVRSFSSVPIIFNAVYDTLIFLAITFRIISYAIIKDSQSARARSFFRGDGLPRMSKALLQSGQIYYFATIWLNIVFATMILIPNLPTIYHSMFSVPNLALKNAMACRVYRAVILGFIKDPESTHHGNTIEFPINAPKASDRGLAFKHPTLDESHHCEYHTDTGNGYIYDGHTLGQWESSMEEGSDICDHGPRCSHMINVLNSSQVYGIFRSEEAHCI